MAEPVGRRAAEDTGGHPSGQHGGERGEAMNPSLNEPLTRGDMVRIRQAFRNGWNVSPVQRQRIIDQLHDVLNDPTRTNRERRKAQETLDLIHDRLIGQETE